MVKVTNIKITNIKLYNQAPAATFFEGWEDANWQDQWDGFYNTQDMTLDYSANFGRQSTNVRTGSYGGSIDIAAGAGVLALKNTGTTPTSQTLWFYYGGSSSYYFTPQVHLGANINGTDDYEGGTIIGAFDVGDGSCQLRRYHLSSTGTIVVDGFLTGSSSFLKSTGWYRMLVEYVPDGTDIDITAYIYDAASVEQDSGTATVDATSFSTDFGIRGYRGAGVTHHLDDYTVTF